MVGRERSESPRPYMTWLDGTGGRARVHTRHGWTRPSDSLRPYTTCLDGTGRDLNCLAKAIVLRESGRGGSGASREFETPLGTFEHGRLVDNVLVTLRRLLDGRPCRPYSGNFLVRSPSGLGAYPDVMVFSGEIQGDPVDPRRAATNPTVIVEVLSESTEEYDRGEKVENYKSIPSLAEYVLVHQNERQIEVFLRSEGWSARSAGPGQSLALRAIGVDLPVDEIY